MTSVGIGACCCFLGVQAAPSEGPILSETMQPLLDSGTLTLRMLLGSKRSTFKSYVEISRLDEFDAVVVREEESCEAAWRHGVPPPPKPPKNNDSLSLRPKAPLNPKP